MRYSRMLLLGRQLGWVFWELTLSGTRFLGQSSNEKVGLTLVRIVVAAAEVVGRQVQAGLAEVAEAALVAEAVAFPVVAEALAEAEAVEAGSRPT